MLDGKYTGNGNYCNIEELSLSVSVSAPFYSDSVASRQTQYEHRPPELRSAQLEKQESDIAYSS